MSNVAVVAVILIVVILRYLQLITVALCLYNQYCLVA